MRIYRYQPAVTLSAKEDIQLHRTTKASTAQGVIRNKTKSYSEHDMKELREWKSRNVRAVWI